MVADIVDKVLHWLCFFMGIDDRLASLKESLNRLPVPLLLPRLMSPNRPTEEWLSGMLTGKACFGFNRLLPFTV